MSYQIDIAGRSGGLLPSQYRWHADVLLLFVGCWAPQLQALEDDLAALRVQLDWRSATGIWLDRWGSLAQMPRPAGAEYEDDEVYRQAIDARWASRRSLGDGDSLLTVAAALIGEPVDGGLLALRQWPPQQVQLDFGVSLSAEARAIAGEVLAAACRLSTVLRATCAIPGTEMWGQPIDLADREQAAVARHAGTFAVQPVPLFMDYLRAGVYDVPELGAL